VRLTIAHVYDFRDDGGSIGGDLLHPEAWDAARDLAGPFGLPVSRAEWERLAAQPDLARRADDVAAVVRSLGARSVCSHGVGVAALELNVHRRLPDVRLCCTDYAPRATERLAGLFVEADVVLHDLEHEPPPSADLHLMHRIDTEFSAETWEHVFERFTEPILFVPAQFLDARRLVAEVGMRLLRPRAVRAGWLRTRDAVCALWSRTHIEEEVGVGGSPAFLLSRRDP
jgi:hypothetical protein